MPLPPLNALRAFEAAARHGGFIDAAEELHVTRGAISRHVKSLESHLDVALFRRHARGVELTAAGRVLLPVLTDAFRRIEEGTRRVAERADVRVICPPAMSVRWLLPKLPEFRTAHPDIRLSVTTDFYGDRGFDGIEYDFAFSIENPPHGRPRNIRQQKLFPYRNSPACSPDLMKSAGPFQRPEDLVGQTLLHEAGTKSDWPDWARHFQVNSLDTDRGDVFPTFDLAVKAAVIGAGVVMADLVLCREELESGALVLPFPDLACDAPVGCYTLIGAADRWEDPALSAFRNWVAEQAGKGSGNSLWVT